MYFSLVRQIRVIYDCDRLSLFQKAQYAANHARRVTLASCSNLEETLLILRVHLPCTTCLRESSKRLLNVSFRDTHPWFSRTSDVSCTKQSTAKKEFHERQRRERRKLSNICENFSAKSIQKRCAFSKSAQNALLLPPSPFIR